MKKIVFLITVFFIAVPLLSEGQEHKLYPYLGIENDSEFICFYNNFKAAVDGNDSAYIANILHYPLKAFNVNHKYILLKNKNDFFKYYKLIFTKELVKVINEQDTNDFSGIGGQGVAVGYDAIWFNAIGDEKHYKFYIVIFNGTSDYEKREKSINH